MTYNTAYLCADRLDRPLARFVAGQLSSAVLIVRNVPDDIETLTVEVGRTPDTSTTPATARANLSANATETDGEWRCYLSPFHFPDVSEDLKYHVMGEDANGNARWLGSGSLIVRECPASGSPVVPSVLPKDAYAYNPTTGLYHKMIATLNEDGEITIAVDETGVPR